MPFAPGHILGGIGMEKQLIRVATAYAISQTKPAAKREEI